MTNKSRLDTLQEDAARTLSEALGAPSRERAALLRATAEDFVTAREHFYDRDGNPDWKGRTHAYRLWVQEALSRANVPAAETNTVSAAVRYHSGNVLRERLDDDTLADLGLRQESPRERSIEKRERHAEVLSIFGGGGAEITDAETIKVAAQMMEAVLRRVSVDAVTKLKKADRLAVQDAAKRVADAAARVAGVTLEPVKVTK